ncbi:MAG TPA: superoxide dismutase family protein [Hypericibacter adhaerens]|jgi:Cu-Zn family superoxide dismutase|uniref:superoxide dismutase[Cu-Zn] n=1 Tax=Hypericibacter adhaerens TaxID=2602016 RepID=UPI002C8BF434|nr:superoxide dismutase family protein [Hypericibacter adhaerens]HWA46220.1 superoxide dismutase family protein [Hypericibacter adhaerens]
MLFRRILPIPMTLLVLGLAAAAAEAAPVSRSGNLVGADGTTLGKVTVTEAPHGVLLRLSVEGLMPGWHGLHFHEKADCEAPGFKSAGSHVHAATPVVHGLMNPEANDDGDLPNLYVGADGTAMVELYSTLVSMQGAGGRPALLDADGSAVVIHANPDDYMSQPIGGAGDRVACAPIK